MEIKNTTRVLYDLVQNNENTRDGLVENTGLSMMQVTNTIKFLKNRADLIKVRYVKTRSRPYRRALYSINPNRYRYVLNLLNKRLKNV